MNLHVVMISSEPAKPFSLPLGTVLLGVGERTTHSPGDCAEA